MSNQKNAENSSLLKGDKSEDVDTRDNITL